jgi:hypothetical protein
MPAHSSSACNACYHKREKMCCQKVLYSLGEENLGKAKILSTSGHGGVEGFAEVFVGFVLWQIEFCLVVSMMI